MAKIHSLKIKNYRSIEEFEQVFYKSNLVCLIGRGDSGKSTILNAISAVLSPNWNYSFTDTDFYNCNVNNPIIIEVSLYKLPNELLTESKFGLFKQTLNSENEVICDITTDNAESTQDILTLKLVVEKDLEPVWFITTNRPYQEDIEIKARDRAKLNFYYVTDYIERHFTWSKGSPLYTLFKQINIDDQTSSLITEANRDLRTSIDTSTFFTSFDSSIQRIKESALKLGLSIDNLKALIDFKNLRVKEGDVSLHIDNNLPIRLSGKGSKRLLSIAIQLELARQNGIVLIDELEQGLEPDRVKFLSKFLKDTPNIQTFFTTHSRDVIVELDAQNIFLNRKNTNSLFNFSNDFQGCLRSNPEAFLSKNVIVCEGATEVGICRALNDFRIVNQNDNLASLSIAIADGKGSNLVEYSEGFISAGFKVCMFCDSDDSSLNSKKETLTRLGIKIVDCDSNNAIEQQIFYDLPWEKVKILLQYAIDENSEQSILSTLYKSSLDDLFVEDNPQIRELIGNKAKQKGWFKRIDHGEIIGKEWFDSLSVLGGKKLKSQYDELNNWIESSNNELS